MSTNFELDPPYATELKAFRELFQNDPEIEFDKINDEEHSITVHVKDRIKYYLLRDSIRDFRSGATVNIEYDGPERITADEVAFLLSGTKYFAGILPMDVPSGVVNYCLFNPEVVQFPNDDISDPWGNFNGLAEDIVRRYILADVRYSTLKKDYGKTTNTSKEESEESITGDCANN